jgi:hypothetical protein
VILAALNAPCTLVDKIAVCEGNGCFDAVVPNVVVLVESLEFVSAYPRIRWG